MWKLNFRTGLGVVLLSLFVALFASTSRQEADIKVAGVEIGISENEVKRRVGEPDSVMSLRDDVKELVYRKPRLRIQLKQQEVVYIEYTIVFGAPDIRVLAKSIQNPQSIVQFCGSPDQVVKSKEPSPGGCLVYPDMAIHYGAGQIFLVQLGKRQKATG